MKKVTGTRTRVVGPGTLWVGVRVGVKIPTGYPCCSLSGRDLCQPKTCRRAFFFGVPRQAALFLIVIAYIAWLYFNLNQNQKINN